MSEHGNSTITAWQNRDRLLAVAVGLLLCALYLATANYGPAQVNDTRAATVGAWSLGTEGTAALPESWPASANYWGVEGPDGRVFVNRFPGVAYWAAPAYAVVAVVDDRDAPAHPFLVSVRPAVVTAATTSATAGALVFVLLRRLTGRGAAVAATLVFSLGTSVWSVAADAMWPHGPALLALTVMLLGWRGRRPLPLLVGAAVAVLVRPHLAVVPIVLAVFCWRRDRQVDAGWMVLGTLLGLTLLTAYSFWAFGVPLPVAGYDVGGHLGGLASHTPWQTVRALALAFVSASHGLLPATPVLVVAVPALLLSWSALPGWTRASAFAGLVYLLVQVRALGHLGGADFFAYRISLEPLLLALPALVLATQRRVAARRERQAVVAVLGLAAIAIHAYGAVVGGVSDETRREWAQIDATVRDEFSDLELGEADLR
jgi:hypothetical protein